MLTWINAGARIWCHKKKMRALPAKSGASIRALRAAARLLLCLALALLPLSAASGAHFEDDPVAALEHHHGSAPATPAADAPLCHHTGACHAFVTPAAPAVVPLHGASRPTIPTLRQPASAAVHRLFRPPIAARA